MRTNTTTCGLLMGLAVATAAITSASNAMAIGPIVADFNNPGSIGRIVDQARSTFAVWTKSDGMGGYTSCAHVNDPGCWLYTQPGPPAIWDVVDLKVETAVYPEAHLNFEDPTLAPPTLCFANGGYGRLKNGQCVAADWIHEPRSFSPHASDEWIDIWVEGFHKGVKWESTGRKQFDLMSFNNKGTVPVQLWVLWYDDTWWVWDNLGPGTHDVSGWAYWIKDAQMGQPDPSGGVITIDDIVVDHVAL